MREETGYEPEFARDRVQIGAAQPDAAVGLGRDKNGHANPCQLHIADLVDRLLIARPRDEVAGDMPAWDAVVVPRMIDRIRASNPPPTAD